MLGICCHFRNVFFSTVYFLLSNTFCSFMYFSFLSNFEKEKLIGENNMHAEVWAACERECYILSKSGLVGSCSKVQKETKMTL